MKVHQQSSVPIQFDSPRFYSNGTVHQAMRPSNQKLNEELRSKADELEKLFALHKQLSTSSRRGVARDVEKRAVEDYDEYLLRGDEVESMSELEDGKGVFYERYMEKRDAKLREEWRAKRGYKEANMKAMHDTIERTKFEMKAQFSGSGESHDLVDHPYEVNGKEETLKHIMNEEEFNNSTSINSNKLVSKTNVSSSRTRITTKSIPKSLHSEEEGDPQEEYEQLQFTRNKSYSGTTYTTSRSYRSTDSSQFLQSKSVSSSTPRRSSVNATSSGYADFRKENTKPSNGISKLTIHEPSPNILPRGKSTNSGIKSRRPEPLRKSSTGPAEFKDLSLLNSNIGNLTPGRHDSMERISGSKPFLKKGNGIGPGSAKRKTSLAIGTTRNGKEFDSLVVNHEDEDESPIESPGSWNSHIRHSLSHVDEASLGSPMRNLHALSKMREAEAIRIRKKWGDAENPFSVSSASRQSPKDASKGFKRLLNFGKKSKGVESMLTDSEGDYEMDYGNDLASPSSQSFISSPANFRSREDHKLNTMKVSRSLFSLPSFRGSESKVR